MVLSPSQLLLFALLCASTHWLIARSEIARPFWSRLDGFFGRLLACPACSGWWLGSVLAGTALVVPARVGDGTSLAAWIAQALAGGVLGAILTPICEGALLWGLDYTRIDTPDEAPPPGAVPAPVPATDSALITPVDSPIRRKPRV